MWYFSTMVVDEANYLLQSSKTGMALDIEHASKPEMVNK